MYSEHGTLECMGKLEPRFPEYDDEFGLAQREEGVLSFWDDESIFSRVTDMRADAPHFVFYEGPPTANGKPGIHHVISRTTEPGMRVSVYPAPR